MNEVKVKLRKTKKIQKIDLKNRIGILPKMRTHTQETLNSMTPQKALQYLIEGNQRFQNNLKANRDLLEQVNKTTEGQWPFATILSCIDSRVSAELVFDQGLGDIFSIRIAGNFINDDILGSMEFACKLSNSKLIVVMGHTNCGAIKGACDNVQLGHLTGLIDKIKPALNVINEPTDSNLRNSKNTEFVNNVSIANVHLAINNIRERSPILKELDDNNEINIVGCLYYVDSGIAEFLN